MSEVTEIILRLLWRFCPIAWLSTIIVRALSRIASWLDDEESYLQLAHSPEDCAFVGGWLSLAEDRLNELIVWKAMRLLKRPWLPPRPCGQFAGHVPAQAVRTPQDIYRRLSRLIALYHDHQRLYEKRAQRLQRLFQEAELHLEIIHHPVASTIPTTTIFPFRSPTTIFSASCVPGASHPAQPIRAPPWPALLSKISPIPTRKHHLREREIMPEMTLVAAARQKPECLLPTPYCRLPATTSAPASRTSPQRHPPPAPSSPKQ